MIGPFGRAMKLKILTIMIIKFWIIDAVHLIKLRFL